jgi:hypothetical protein
MGIIRASHHKIAKTILFYLKGVFRVPSKLGPRYYSQRVIHYTCWTLKLVTGAAETSQVRFISYPIQAVFELLNPQ